MFYIGIIRRTILPIRPNTPHGRMMTTLLAGIAQFERDLLSERVKSGLAAAHRRGKKLDRQKG